MAKSFSKSGSSAAASLEGYFYQLDVSIWLALYLLIAKQLAHSVRLEPATEEDLEAQLDDSDTGKLAVIRPLIGAFAPGHHGYQRACVLISGQASIGPFGSPVFARARKTEPPSRLILSQTSAGSC
jgi:hypothetical protein